jgi:hypothetical protein
VNRSLLQLSAQGENRLYGHLSILSKYCEITEPVWLNGYLQHGWNGCDGFSNYAGHKRSSKKYIWSKRALNDLVSRGGKNAFVIGSPWLYNLKTINKLEANPVSNSKKIIAYPLHAQPWAPKNYLHSEYASYLKENYGEITISLHWTDYSNFEILNTYKSLGHNPITYGVGTPWIKGFDNNFLNNQLSQLENHGKIVTNAMQTSVLYAMSLGLQVEFGGPASWKKKIDEVGTYGDYGQDYWREKVLNQPEKTWKAELGFDELLSPKELMTTLGWNKSIKLNSSFVVSRLADILKDGSIIEKISYFTKGRN